MSRVFLSHSSRDSLQAIALKRWLVEQVPGLEDEIFLDLDPYTGIAPGERWKEALRRANERCEVVICLISAHWESSRECLTEYRTAENLGKLILCARLEPVESITREWQRCDLFGDGPATEIPIEANGTAGVVVFRTEALQQLRRGLRKAGIGAEHFAWPPSSDPDRAPYRGWEPLQETDAAVFFGRDGQIVRGLDALRGMRSSGVESLFVILGPSGTGKSSFLRAGLLPRLRREDRHFLPLEIVRPERSALTGEQGFARAIQELRTGLGLRHPSLGQIKEACVRNNTDRIREWLMEARNVAAERLQEAPEETEDPESLEESPAPTLVLPLDQAEELFNADAGPEAAGFLDLVARLLEYDDGTGPALIVASTIRADFYEALQTAPQLAGIKSVVFDELKPMPVVQFKEVILGPAARATAAGHPLTLEPALVDRLLADCTAGADTLPLLALTLARLYQDYGARGQLTLAEYEAMGGLQRVVQTEVDALLSHHPEQRQRQLALLRSAFIPWLATINPDNDQPIRRVASLADLPGDARPLVDAMVEKRLLVQDNRGGETVIEVALESLLRQWDELAGWLAAEREDLKEADNLERAAAAWERSSRNEAWLFEGGRLIGAERLSARPGFRNRLDPNREFLLASRAREEERSVAEKRRKEAELQSAREKQEAAEAHAAVLRKRSKVLRMVLAVTAVIALVAVLGFVLAFFAQDQAVRSADEADQRSREATALKLAAEGQSMLAGARPGGELRGMQQMLAAQSLVRTSEGERVIVGAVVAQRDVHKMVQVTPASEERPASPVNSAAFSPDGKLAVSGSADGSIRLWDAETGEQLWEQGKAHEGAVKSVAFSPDDDGGARIVSGGEDETIRLWDTETGKSRGEPLTGHDGFINSVAFSPNDGGARIVSGARTAQCGCGARRAVSSCWNRWESPAAR
ncbi:nSTAND1 domain-containing NTPase [Crystallibacter degradans]|uniref:nSTAND1 domain-containing NTPase n=1 Tax=Crystallibacter degradans TaxID=2726743 RepID=UPI001476172F|nr:TIR domain-containing protein [Arthrobacter sp. SF27]NMR28105.1 TIR domain-containing protein [Arthrobacter sp. SF27]